jgi:hypothetical protein
VGLKVLCAGCAADEREAAERTVREVLDPRATGDSWTVSLVKLGAQWSITLDAPDAGIRSTFMAPADGLREAITHHTVQPSQPAPTVPGPTRGPTGGEGPWKCESCQGPFAVTYEKIAGEPEISVAVACPRCWHINHVPVGETAAASQDYRAEEV